MEETSMNEQPKLTANINLPIHDVTGDWMDDDVAPIMESDEEDESPIMEESKKTEKTQEKKEETPLTEQPKPVANIRLPVNDVTGDWMNDDVAPIMESDEEDETLVMEESKKTEKTQEKKE